MIQRNTLYDDILMTVEKPSRYVGSEYNAVHKDPADVDLRVALVFPDLCELGLGNLGLLILYAILNDRRWCWAERAYAPAPDMEQALRQRGLPLFTNESKTPLDKMDLVGFTLQSELTYTNVLTILDLSGIPLRSNDRSDAHPLIVAGGPSTFNPEPMAPFIDFFVFGDGEEVVVEIAERLRDLKDAPRAAKLEAMAKIAGVYVPALYPFETAPNGRVVPKVDAPRIAKRVVRDLNPARFPTNYIVPFTQQVHDRVGIEVMRGCTHGCRFCQAGMIGRPVRERSIDGVDALMGDLLANTGYEEVSLVSLSTCDYSRVQELLQRASERAADARAAVSLPSLRLDTFAVDLADRVSDVRRSGLTFAPEAASPRLRAVINKWIPDEDLLNVAAEAYRRGWGHVKLYFMIGLPTERDEDVEAIVGLAVRALEVGRKITRRAQVNLGVSTFVPKAFTPFQWAEQISIDEAHRRQGILKKALGKYPGIKFGRHMPESTFIEGILARGDRRAADLLETAWRNGARFESWDEKLDARAWMDAIEQTGFDVAAALGARDLDERLPWDHIDTLVRKDWLQDDYRRAMALEYARDCRVDGCRNCGVMDREHGLCAQMLTTAVDAEKEVPARPKGPQPEPPAVQRIRFRIGRTGEARFLSHLELVNAWVRALRRARVPLSYSQGFHEHPKVAFSTAPPVGEESEGDYMDVVVTRRLKPKEVLAQLQDVLPRDFRAFEAWEEPPKAKALMDAAAGFAYTLFATAPPPDLGETIARILAAERLDAKRGGEATQGKAKPKRVVNIRPMLYAIELRSNEGGHAVIDVEIRKVEGRSVRIRELLDVLGLEPATTRVLKRATHLDIDTDL